MAVGLAGLPVRRPSPGTRSPRRSSPGSGTAIFWPSQSTLLAGLTPHARRHAAFAVQRVTRNLGIGLGGVAGGLIATTSDPTSFTVLFLVDAVTFLAFVAAIAFVPEPRASLLRGGARDARRATSTSSATACSSGSSALNVLFVAAGYAQLELLPVFAKNEAGVSREGDRAHLLREHARDRDRPASDREGPRGPAPHEGARGHDRVWADGVADRASRPARRSKPPPRRRSSPSRPPSSRSASASRARRRERSSPTSRPTGCAGATWPSRRPRGRSGS